MFVLRKCTTLQFLEDIYIKNKTLKKHKTQMTPRTNLSNPYYYVKSNIIYKISNMCDDVDDPCIKHYVVYETENKELKKGEYYLDVNGNYVQAESAGTYAVSKGIINETECKKVFPYITFTYNIDGDNTDYAVLYWLDNFIKDGDQLSGVRFVKTVHGETESTEDYAKTYKDEVIEALTNAVIKGQTNEKAKNGQPQLLFANAGETFTFNGKTVKMKSITSSGGDIFPIKDDEISESVFDTINAKTIAYANSLLNTIDKKVSTDDLINNGNTESNE